MRRSLIFAACMICSGFLAAAGAVVLPVWAQTEEPDHLIGLPALANWCGVSFLVRAPVDPPVRRPA